VLVDGAVLAAEVILTGGVPFLFAPDAFNFDNIPVYLSGVSAGLKPSDLGAVLYRFTKKLAILLCFVLINIA
jgi:hypothetical protein